MKNSIYYKTNKGILYNENSIQILSNLSDESIDLIITSPPYDDLRTYKNQIDKNWSFEIFKKIANELKRILKKGGIIVWIVGDSVKNGSETLTSFKHALYFKEKLKLNIHDTMIFQKNTFSFPQKNRYYQVFEYMFIISKGKPNTFNPIKDRPNKYEGSTCWGKVGRRQKDGTIKYGKKIDTIKKYGMRHNIWKYTISKGFSHPKIDKDLVYKHPATFPYQLAIDHILSWSNEDDLILDPFAGSGTSCIAAEELNRKWIGVEISSEYCDIIKKRFEIRKK